MFGDMISLTLCKAKAHTHAERRGGANGCRGSRRERARTDPLGCWLRVIYPGPVARRFVSAAQVEDHSTHTHHHHHRLFFFLFSLFHESCAKTLFFCACASDAHERPVHQLFYSIDPSSRIFVIINIIIISCCLITSSQSPRKRTLKSDSMGILQGDSPTPGPAMYWVSLLSLDF